MLLQKYGPVQESTETVTNDARMSARFCITSERPDLEGDIVVTAGVDLSNHRRNPVVLLCHDLKTVIGKSESDNGLYTVEPRPELGKMYSTAFFQTNNEIGVQTYSLVKGGYLRGASIGFQVVQSKVRGRSENGRRPPLNISKSTLREWSVVPLPMNPDAVREILSRSMVEGNTLSPYIRKALEPHASVAPVWSNGATLQDAVFDVPKSVVDEARRAGVAASFPPRTTLKGFDQNEPRDADGKWTDSGSGGGTATAEKPAKKEKKPVHKLTATEINTRLDKVDEERSKLTDEMIDSGRGHETYTDWKDKDDDLSMRLRNNLTRRLELRNEIEARYGPNSPHRLPTGRGGRGFFGPRNLQGDKMSQIQSIFIKADQFPSHDAALTWLKSYGYTIPDGMQPTNTTESGTRYDFFPEADAVEGSAFEAALDDKAIGTFAINKAATEPLVMELEPAVVQVPETPELKGVMFTASESPPAPAAIYTTDDIRKIVSDELAKMNLPAKAINEPMPFIHVKATPPEVSPADQKQLADLAEKVGTITATLNKVRDRITPRKGA